jgi:tRNA pseudouridine13 synthase
VTLIMTEPAATSQAEPAAPALEPHVPVFEHTDLPAVGGRVGPEPADFMVDELPLYAASGAGEHWYVRLAKERATTFDLVKAVAAAAGVNERDIGYAGMKDKHAITTQWLSVPGAARTAPEAWALPAAFRVLEVSRHANKLRTGHLAANRFRIRVVGVEPDALLHGTAIAQRVSEQGVGNYFGHQRFGVGRQNLAVALDALRRRRFDRLYPNKRKLLSSVIQSEIFNRYLSARLALGRERLLAGEVVRLEGSKSLFVALELEQEQPRLERGDVHLTGPIWGPKMLPSQAAAHELERAALAELGLSEAELEALGRWAPGTRRDLVLKPSQLTCSAGAEGSVVFEFVLPAGSYATVLIETFTRARAGQSDEAAPELD